MPKNKGKGGKTRRRGKADSSGAGSKRELVQKSEEDGTEYAQVLRMLGNGRLEAHCFDGEKRLCHIRGKMQKKVWINVGDIVLVSIREFEQTKADVVLKYSPDEARVLKQRGELPESTRVNEGMEGDEGHDDQIEFVAEVEGEDDDEDESEDDLMSGGRNRNRGGGGNDDDLDIDNI